MCGCLVVVLGYDVFLVLSWLEFIFVDLVVGIGRGIDVLEVLLKLVMLGLCLVSKCFRVLVLWVLVFGRFDVSFGFENWGLLKYLKVGCCLISLISFLLKVFGMFF